MALVSKYLRRKEHIERDNIITNLYSLHESLLYSKGKLDSRRKLKQENLCFINKLNRVDQTVQKYWKALQQQSLLQKSSVILTRKWS